MDLDSVDALAEALGRLRQLRMLIFGFDDDEGTVARRCLAAIGKMTQLDYLCLGNATIANESLADLASLTRLKTLHLDGISRDRRASEPPLLARLPVLPELRTLRLEYSDVGDCDLDYLSRLPKLTSLRLLAAPIAAAGFAKLAALPSLDELAFDDEALSAAGLEQLLALQHLRALHIEAAETAAGEIVPYVDEEKREPCLQALRKLRQANPGIVIDGDYWRDLPSVPDDGATARRDESFIAREIVREWEELGRQAVPLGRYLMPRAQQVLGDRHAEHHPSPSCADSGLPAWASVPGQLSMLSGIEQKATKETKERRTKPASGRSGDGGCCRYAWQSGTTT